MENARFPLPAQIVLGEAKDGPIVEFRLCLVTQNAEIPVLHEAGSRQVENDGGSIESPTVIEREVIV